MAEINITKIGTEELLVPILGTSPLLINRFSQKAKQQMLDAAQGKRKPKTPKDPEAEYEAAAYRLTDGGYGFPVIGFKAATVGAARFYGKDVTMTSLRQFIFMTGEIGEDGLQLARIEGNPKVREDVVRVGQGTDLRYRPEFWPWTTWLDVTYTTSALTRDSIVSLIDAGGRGVGVGEWRPEKRGDMGTYTIDPDREIRVIG